MSREMLEGYRAKAGKAGVELHFMSEADFVPELSSFLSGLNEGKVLLSAFPGDARLGRSVREALSAAGREEVEASRAAEAEVGITWCETFVAQTGSLVVSTAVDGAMSGSLLPPLHVAVSRSSGCVEDLGVLLAAMGKAPPSRFTLITGPSRTGDIEATMTTCVHGPGRVVHFIIA